MHRRPWSLLNKRNYRLREPEQGEAIRIVADFGCGACKRGGYQWAEIVVTDGRISSVEAIALDAAAIDRVHAIDDTLGELYRDRLSVDLDEMSGADRLAYLREHPPARFG